MAKKFSLMLASLLVTSGVLLQSPLASAQSSQDLYQQFLRDLKRGDTATESQEQQKPQTQQTQQPEQPKVEQEQKSYSPQETEVRATGHIVEKKVEGVSNFFLIVDVKNDVVSQTSHTFEPKIPGDNTSWYAKSLRLYSHDQEVIRLIIRAARNHPNTNQVQIGGTGVRNDEGLLIGISMNEGGYVLNKKDPNNPEFNRETPQVAPSKPQYTKHYGFIYVDQETGRAWMEMTDRNGNPLGIDRIMLNEQNSKWREPYRVAEVDKREKDLKFLVEAEAYVGESSGGIPYIRYVALNVFQLINTQLSPLRQNEVPTASVSPERAAVQEPIEVTMPEELVIEISDFVSALTVQSDVDSHESFGKVNSANITPAGDSFIITIENSSTETAVTLVSSYEGSAEAYGTYAGYEAMWTITHVSGDVYEVSAGANGGLPGGNPIIWRVEIPR